MIFKFIVLLIYSFWNFYSLRAGLDPLEGRFWPVGRVFDTCALFDKEARGSLSAEDLSHLMGALLGVPQHNTDQLYTEASRQGRLTPEDLLRVLTTHPTYQRVVNEYLQPEEAGSQLSFTSLTNGKAVNNNGNMHNGNGSVHYNKKLE